MHHTGETTMKLINKKITNSSRTSTTTNQTMPHTTTNPLRLLHIFPTQTRPFNLGLTEFNRLEEKQKLEIETELKRTQARIYASITLPK